jgi:hypothetical protein
VFDESQTTWGSTLRFLAVAQTGCKFGLYVFLQTTMFVQDGKKFRLHSKTVTASNDEFTQESTKLGWEINESELVRFK